MPVIYVKKFCQAIRVRPAHCLKVLQLSPDFNASFLFCTKLKSFSCHGKSQQ